MSRFLQHISVENFGALADKAIGPLGPGMNVVFGKNEAGKSTVAALIGGVLFGWEDDHDHGVRNTYRPASGTRSGTLTWSGEADAPAAAAPRATAALLREGELLSGSTEVLDDIDRDTYETIFSLTSDELRSLRTSSDVTARLLTAGAGTSSSPSAAFVEIEQRIAALTAPAPPANAPWPSEDDGSSRAPGVAKAPIESIPQLEEMLERKQDEIKEAASRTELLVQEDRELHELGGSRKGTAERIDALNDEIEDLIAWRAELSSIEERSAKCSAELEKLKSERDELAQANGQTSTVDPRLLALDPPGERVLRDRLDELSEAQEKLDRMVDAAKENSSTSSAAYEALCEIDEEDLAASRRLRNRPWQAAVSVLLPVAFVAIGVPLFLHGRQINSLSISALGIGLVVSAVFLAAAAFVVLFGKPKGDNALENRRKDAQWVMLQDRKKLDACLDERKQLEQQIADLFDNAGLSAAEGSIRQARSLLDEASVLRASRANDAQRASSVELRIRAGEKELADLDASRRDIADKAKLADPSLHRIDALMREKASQRDALLAASDRMSQRFGELTRELELARNDRSFNRLKLEHQHIRTRLREAKHELISLLLAKRMLDRSITAWEQHSQPEVYDQASQLLALITDGKWTRVSTSTTGSLVAIAADGTERDPRHLSLGTCQQLYLALRIALLVTAKDVGRAIPVLADDILVNFDAERRLGAARALAELATHRQVIVFTCHESTAAALHETSPTATRINL